MMNDWDPMTHLYEEPTLQCLLRVKKDIAEFNAQPPPRLFIPPEESDVTQVHVLMLGAPGGLCDWSPAQSLSSTLISIQSLVGDNVYDRARDQYETIRVAVCDQVDAALKEDAKLPPAFQEDHTRVLPRVVRQVRRCCEGAAPDGLETGRHVRGAAKPAEYEKVLTRLQSLKHKVEKKKEAEAAVAVAAAQAAVAAENHNY
ncbi:hypothetical protein MRX96_053015 [Rhipicephalus microplus]